MPAKRAYGMDQEFYPWSPIVTLRSGGSVSCESVTRRRLHLICCGPRRSSRDQGDRRAQHNQNGTENDKALACTPVVGYGAHCRRNYDRRQSVHGLPQPDHRTLTVRTDCFSLNREHHRLDDPLQPAAERLRHEEQGENAAGKRRRADQ